MKARVAPTVTLPVPSVAFASPAGSSIDVDYQVYKGSKRLVQGHSVAKLSRSQAVTFRPNFKPAAGARYSLRMDAGTPDGESVSTTYELVAGK